MIDFLKGKKTYIIAIIMVIIAGLQARGYITADQAKTVEAILTGAGLAALRAGINNAVKGA